MSSLTRRFLFTGILITGLIGGCRYDKAELLDPCQINDTNYSTAIAPIIQSTCVTYGCHTPGNTVIGDFTNYQEIKMRVDDGTFKQLVLDQRTMPVGGGLTEKEYQQLKCWVEAGAPEN